MDEQIKAFIRRSWDIIETPGDPACSQAPARPCAAPAESFGDLHGGAGG